MKKLIQSLGFAVLAKVSVLCKLSFVVGSSMLWFSGPALLVPLSGMFLGTFGAVAVLASRMVIHFLLFKTVTLSFLALCIPGFCASLYFAHRTALIRLIVPLACMILFAMHPVGSQAFIYSLYWLIPVLLFLTQRTSFFFEALGATLTAHAVGSVIWLYTVPTMTPEMWLALIPLVAVERLMMAVGMVIAYRSMLLGRQLWNAGSRRLMICAHQ